MSTKFETKGNGISRQRKEGFVTIHELMIETTQSEIN